MTDENLIKATCKEPKNAKVTHKGDWKIADDITIECYVTDDKRRLLSLRGTARAMDLRGGGSGALLRNLKAAWIQPFLSDHLKICKAYVMADNRGILNENQSAIAKRLLHIMSAFAKVGIVALVDEITGYQKEREEDELQKILSKYISAEFLEWTKRFPDEFYEQIFRLKEWGEFQTHHKMPQIVGKITNEIVYKQLPEGVLEELRNKTPKSESGNNLYKFHQSLTLDTGIPHLDKHLVSVITLMKVADDWDDFIYLFNKSYSKNYQLRFDFDKESK